MGVQYNVTLMFEQRRSFGSKTHICERGLKHHICAKKHTTECCINVKIHSKQK